MERTLSTTREHVGYSEKFWVIFMDVRLKSLSATVTQAAIVSMLSALAACNPAVTETIIPDEPSCPRCAISFRTVATLGDFDGEGAFADVPVHVRTDSRGRYFVFAGGRPGLPQVFDSNGKFVSLIGRSGQGPGEISTGGIPHPVAGDSVLVIESPFGRASLFTPEFKFVRQYTMPPRISRGSVWHWPDLVVFHGLIQTKDRYGWPLHVLSFNEPSVEIVKSGGSETGEIRPENGPSLQTIAISSGSEGQRWTGGGGVYRLSRRDAALTELQVLERKPKWWSRPSTTWYFDSNRPPDPQLYGLQMDSEGLLWVYTRVAGTNWRDGLPSAPKPGTEVRETEARYEKLYRTIVEVIDPRAGRVVVSTSVDQYFVTALPGRRAAAYVATPEGVPQLRILEFTITGR